MTASPAPLTVHRLRCEHVANPLGVDAPAPRLTWEVQSPRRGARQVAYRILVADAPDTLAAGIGDVWDSGLVTSGAGVLVPYAGPPLRSRQRVRWTVHVMDDVGETAVAPPAWWEMGLLDASDWDADWITGKGIATPDEPSVVTYLRSTLTVDAPVLRARAYVTALGLYELHCNGRRVGDLRFTPGWTDYRRRIQYQVLDLTDHIVEGENVVGALLADGWYAGWIGFTGEREHYGKTAQFLAQIEVDTPLGRITLGTGPGWHASTGPVRSSDMLHGELFDARLLHASWCTPGSVSTGWREVRTDLGTGAARVVSPAPPVRVLTRLSPRSVVRTGRDTHRVDVGQNMVGWLRLRLDGAADTKVEVRHAEVTNADGSLYLDNLRSAKALDTYILDGSGPAWFEPVFTFHGFRHAEVSGHPGDLTPDDVVGVVCGSDVERTGDFSCSDARVNQLHANIVWSARGNFFDIPTDCPQRDERLGWMGDAQVFTPTAAYLFDTAAFFTKWCRDIIDAQSDAGGFPDVAPRAVDLADGAPGWGDAGVIVPWTISNWHGDRALLEMMYPPMRRWIRYVHEANPNLLWLERRNNDIGDWLSVDAETDKDVIATAFFCHSTRLTARAADVLGRTDDAEALHDLADRIRTAFQESFVLPDGRVKSETQTAYALALRFDLLPRNLRPRAVEHLVADIEGRGVHLSTGFLGVAHLLPALSEGGRDDVAHELLLTDTWPSWLYSVKAGATTIWERWDGWTAEHGFADPEMNSFNHYAFGAVGEWLYRTVAGVAPSAPEDGGPARLSLAPRVCAGLEWARATYQSPYGPVRCAWHREADGLRLDVAVPVGTSALVAVPAPPDATVLEDDRPLHDVGLVGKPADGHVLVEVVAGSYHFSVTASAQSKEPSC